MNKSNIEVAKTHPVLVILNAVMLLIWRIFNVIRVIIIVIVIKIVIIME